MASKDYNRSYRERNRESLTAKGKEYYSANVERIRERGKLYRAKNRDAIKARKAAYRAANGERLRAKAKDRWVRERESGRVRRQARKYGVTVAWLLARNDKCATCGLVFAQAEGRLKLPHVDHDHSSGKARGVLCFSCNAALGRVKDDPRRLIALAKYLMLG